MKKLLTRKMVAFVAIATFAVLSTGSAKAQDANDPNADNLFDINRILTLNIMMDPCDWDTLRFACPEGQCIPDANSDHEYFQASLQCGTVGPMLVAIRRKNDLAEPNETDPQKISFKIDINRYIPGQLFAGKKKLSLENGSEMSTITEGLTWNIYRAASDSFVSGRAAWVKVYLNGQYKGLYTNVEQVDKIYLTDHIGDNNGFLFKSSEYEGEVQRTREDETSPFAFNWYPFDHPDDPNNPEVPTPADWRDQALWRINMPYLLSLAAAENFTGNTDGTVQKDTNFWYYDLSTDPNSNDPNFQVPRWYFPWDLDTTLRNTEISRDILHPGDGGHLWQGLIEELDEAGEPFAEPTFQADYLDIYRNLLDGPLKLSNLLALVNNIESVIGAEVDADPYTDLTTTITAAQEFQRIRDFLAARTDYINDQPDMLVPPPGTILLDDGFEDTVWDANWNDITHNWLKSTGEYHSDSASAWAKQGNTGYFTCDALGASDANAIYVDFWVMTDRMESGDIELYYYNGTTYNFIADLSNLGGNNEWLHYTDTIIDSQYFVSNFQIRFNATPDDNKEDVWVDDVIITKEIIFTGVAPSITSTPVIKATVNELYSYDVDATGIPDPNYSLMTAPAGMTINAITGVIDWTPTEAQIGVKAVVVEATNSKGSDIQTFGIEVDGVTPEITSIPVTTADVNQPYTYDVNSIGIPTPAYSLITAPAGMTINAATGLINWTPTEAQVGLNTITVEATNIAGFDSQSFDIDVAGIAPVILSTAVTAATVNQPYSYDVDANGIPAPTYALTVSPANMTINTATGVIDWTPNETQLGLNAVTVEVTNSEGTDTQSFDIDVAGTAPVILSTAVTAATVNQPYSYDVDANGIPAPTYALTVSPANMTINTATGVIDWTPNETQLGLN
ncbi:MAG: putative Ig domain-containing protein, partial [Planctomycetota bacterium]